MAAAAALARSRTELLVGDPEMRGEAIRQFAAVTDYVVEIRTARTLICCGDSGEAEWASPGLWRPRRQGCRDP